MKDHDLNHNLIRSIAWSFHRTTGIELEELISEATIAYLEALKTYRKSKKTKLSTWAYLIMRNHLIAFYKKSLQPREWELLPETPPDPFHSYSVKEQLEQMGGCAKQICEMIFKAPEEFLCHPPKMARGKIRQKLRKQGWSYPNIWAGIREVKEMINTLNES